MAQPYRYLVESIRAVSRCQQSFARKMEAAGFGASRPSATLTGGIVAIHSGWLDVTAVMGFRC